MNAKRAVAPLLVLGVGVVITAAVLMFTATSLRHTPNAAGVGSRVGSTGQASPTHTAPPTAAAPPPSMPTPAPARLMLTVPAQSQYPQLTNGCEVTSASMLLSAAGHPIDKMTLANEQPTDPTPAAVTTSAASFFHRVIRWGDPNIGFVGNVAGFPGYGIYHGPITALINRELPGDAVDLTGHPFDDITAQLNRRMPVVIWTTATFAPTDDWVTWQGPNGPVRATQLEHAVLLVGFSDTQLFVNDPISGGQAIAVDRASTLDAWRQLGSQAVTIRTTA